MRIIIFSILFFSLLFSYSMSVRPGSGIREPMFCGTWYPEDPKALSNTIDRYINGIKLPHIGSPIKSVIVPHAGYMFSGWVAGYAYRCIKGASYKTVLIIGPSHRVPFRGVSVDMIKAYRTPLGMVELDRSLIDDLLKDGSFKYIPKAHQYEHSIELQIPFLQKVLKDFKIVPIIMGSQDYETAKWLSEVILKEIVGRGDVLIVSTTDLSHYHPEDIAMRLDKRFIKYVKRLDPESIWKCIRNGRCEACGYGPVMVALMIAKGLNLKNSQILKYATSSYITKDKSNVVGYMSSVLY